MAGKDLIAEEKEQINEEADAAFGAEDMVSSLEAELAGDADDSLGNDRDEDDEAIGDGLVEAVDDGSDDEAAPAADGDRREEGRAGPDRGDGRDDLGKFASKEAKDASEKATADAKRAGKSPAEQQAAGAAAAAAAKPAPAAAPEAKWEPLQIRADKAIHPIDEAKVQKVTDAKGGEHFVIAVPAKDYPRFQQRLGRGIAADRRWRELQEKEREIDFQRSAPKPRSDAEIEATMFIEALSKMQGTEEGSKLLDEIFEPQELENLKLRVQIAQGKEKTDFATAEEKRRSDASAGDEWSRFQADTLVNEAFDLVEKYADETGKRPLEGMTPDEIRGILQDLAMPVIDKLVYRENGETFVNNEYLFKLLQRGRGAPRTPAPTPSDAPAVPDKKVAGAERFNKGQDSAAQPRSTSLRQNRGTRPQGNPRTSRDQDRRPQDDRTAQQIAEDQQRKARRKMMTSPSLDFDDEEDDS